MSKPTEDVLGRDVLQPLSDRLVKAVLGPRPDPAEELLELRVHLLDLPAIMPSKSAVGWPVSA
jgi:hypothetical protein